MQPRPRLVSEKATMRQPTERLGGRDRIAMYTPDSIGIQTDLAGHNLQSLPKNDPQRTISIPHSPAPIPV